MMGSEENSIKTKSRKYVPRDNKELFMPFDS